MILNDNEPISVAELTKANRELTESLRKCQDLVTQCRDKLAASGEASFFLLPKKSRAGRSSGS